MGEVRKTGIIPFSNIKVPSLHKHVWADQLGPKPPETQHLAPDGHLPHPRPGFNKHCADVSTKLFWPGPASLDHSMSELCSPGELGEPAEEEARGFRGQ